MRILLRLGRALSTSARPSSSRTVGLGAFGLGLLGAGAWGISNKALAEGNKNSAASAPGAPAAPTHESWHASINIPAGRLNRQSTLFDQEPDEEISVTKCSKFYPFLIISHPRAVVAQSALSVLTELHPSAEILVVSDKYNFDDAGGNRMYSGWQGLSPNISGQSNNQNQSGRQFISSFTATKSKLDEELLMPLANQTYGKQVTICSKAYAVRLDVKNKLVELSDGTIVAFGKCLLATGCREAKLPGIPEHLKSHVTNLRKVKDFDKVQNLVKEGKVKNIVVVGGGFLGCQVAAKLAELGEDKHVEVIHAYVEPGALYRYVPTYFSDYVTERLRVLGVSERPYHMVLSIKPPTDKSHNLQLALQGFEKATLQCGHVVFAPTHLEGNVELAEKAGLEIDKHCGGVMVNSELLARSDIYVAGDTASYPDKVLGRRRMQSYDHSYHSGALAAHNMGLNAREAYNHLPVITSSGGPMAMEVVVLGDIDSNVEMYSIAQTAQSSTHGWEEWQKGIVYYLKNKKVVGVMLLNLSERTDDARRLIRQGMTYASKHDGESIPDLDKVIDLGIKNPVARHSPARGQGLSRFHTTHN